MYHIKNLFLLTVSLCTITTLYGMKEELLKLKREKFAANLDFLKNKQKLFEDQNKATLDLQKEEIKFKQDHSKAKHDLLVEQNKLKSSELEALHILKVSSIQTVTHIAGDLTSRAICEAANKARRKYFGDTTEEELALEYAKEQAETKKAEKAFLNSQELYQDLQSVLALCKEKAKGYHTDLDCKAHLAAFVQELERKRPPIKDFESVVNKK